MTRRGSVLVVGAGAAGLAAAVELSSRGISVTVLEQHRRGGGRAYSFTDRTTGETIDNGQHALIAGCTSTMQYLDLIGTRGFLYLHRRPSLAFHHPLRGLRHFTFPRLPSFFHLAWGILTTGLFSPGDRLRLLRLGLALTRFRDDDPFLAGATVAQWLKRHGQSPETVRTLWEPLAVAIMNERIDRASALLFVRCLRRAFLAAPGDAALLLPSVGLSELLVTPACKFLESRGGRVVLGARVTETIVRDGAVTGVRLADGSEVTASALILAVPTRAIGSILPREMPSRSLFLRAEAQPLSPIISIHLWYEADFMPDAAIGVVGRTVQWVFYRRKIEETTGQGGHLSCVISAAGALADEPDEVILEGVLKDLRAVFGHGSSPLHSLIIREKRATFSPSPDFEAARPSQMTDIPNLFIAGDWTATGLPGTLEGAIWSGQRCAGLVQARQLHDLPSLT
jgi:squalene-associated FAD-dependent desaturase